MAEILTVAKRPVLKDHIIHKCGLSSLQRDRYLNILLEAGLLDAYPAIDLKHVGGPKTRRRMICQTSQKGLEFLKRYNELLSLMEIPLKYAPKLKFLWEQH